MKSRFTRWNFLGPSLLMLGSILTLLALFVFPETYFSRMFLHLASLVCYVVAIMLFIRGPRSQSTPVIPVKSTSMFHLALIASNFLMFTSGAMFVIARFPGRQVPAPLWFDQWVMPLLPFSGGIICFIVAIIIYAKREL